jgi:beta-glucosidase
MTVTVPVTNTGKLDGDEVIQVYVKSLDDAAAPIKSLAGFARVNIPAGKTKTVKIELNKDAFSFYDEATDGLKFKSGRYRILYGGSSLDKDLKSIDITL